MFMFMISMLSTASPTKSQCYTFAVITLVCMLENTSECYCLVLIGFSLSLYLGGQLLTLDEVKEGLPSHSQKVLSESKWTFITQEVCLLHA
jgi:hypothetical protein